MLHLFPKWKQLFPKWKEFKNKINMAQQTAVEWFYQRILAKDINEVFEHAKEMEKQQIIDAYLNACARVTPYGYYNDSAEQYYTENYV